MNPYIRSILALTLCGAMLLPCTACGKEEASTPSDDVSDYDFHNDGAYGTVESVDNTSYSLPITYDKNFLDEAELQQITDYFYAVQTQDKDLFDSVTEPSYIDFLLETAYSDLLNTDAYLAQLNEAFLDALPDGTESFSFSMIEVTNCTEGEGADSQYDSIVDMYDDFNGEGWTEEHLSSCKTLTVVATMTDDGTNYLDSQEMTVILINLDDTLYVCP